MTTNAEVMIKKGFLDKESLKKYITEFFKPENEILITEQKYNVVQYRNFCSEGMIIYFEEKVENDYHSNRKSEILGDDFKYTQEIGIEFNSDIPDVDQYFRAIKFCKYLKAKTEDDILFASDILDEICLFHEDKITFTGRTLEQLIFDK